MEEFISDSFVIIFTTPIFIIAIILEWFLSYKYDNETTYRKPSTLENFYTFGVYSVVDIVFRGLGLSLLFYFYQFKLFDLELTAIYWISLFIGADLFYWCMHFVSHNCRLFWATHSVHHSSNEFNITVALRSDLLQVFTKFVYFIPLALLGFRPIDIMSMYLISQIYGNFLHTKHTRRNKWIEYIFITPSLHRVHHSSQIKHLDRNMGMVLSIWDRIFGTYQAEIEKATNYGILKPNHGMVPYSIFTHEFIRIFKDLKKDVTLKTKLRYIFYKPGWSHDGSTKTTSELRDKLH